MQVVMNYNLPAEWEKLDMHFDKECETIEAANCFSTWDKTYHFLTDRLKGVLIDMELGFSWLLGDRYVKFRVFLGSGQDGEDLLEQIKQKFLDENFTTD